MKKEYIKIKNSKEMKKLMLRLGSESNYGYPIGEPDKERIENTYPTIFMISTTEEYGDYFISHQPKYMDSTKSKVFKIYKKWNKKRKKK